MGDHLLWTTTSCRLPWLTWHGRPPLMDELLLQTTTVTWHGRPPLADDHGLLDKRDHLLWTTTFFWTTSVILTLKTTFNEMKSIWISAITCFERLYGTGKLPYRNVAKTVNHFSPDVGYSRLHCFLTFSSPCTTRFRNEKCLKSAITIASHLKLCLALANHNFK